MSESKPSNPKQALGSDKFPFHLWPETATLLGTLGMLEGMLKYGRSNFRASGVKASIYYDACKRHLTAWFEGQDKAPDSEIHHLGHALACLAILVDAMAASKLEDDRMYEGGYQRMLDEVTPEVKRLKEKYADMHPHHFTMNDNGTGLDVDPKLTGNTK